MMLDKTKLVSPIQLVTTSLRSLALYFAMSLFISACGGGISGTGDGGPGIIVEQISEMGGTDGADSSVDGATEDTSAVASPTDAGNIALSPDVSQLVPQVLQNLNTRTGDIDSVALALAAQLTALQQEVNVTLQSISTAPGTPDESFSEQFDTANRYIQGNTETVLANDATTSSSYLFSTNDERVIYVLQQGDTTTVRQLTKSSNDLLQANVISLTDGETVIQADLNRNGTQSYITALSTTETSIVFEQHPTDTTIARHRELIDQSGNLQTIQSCTASSQNCVLDSSWTNTDTATSTQFNNALTTIEGSLNSIIAPFGSIPPDTAEAVLTEPTSDNFTEEQILCGLQRVDSTTRVFCVQPPPFTSTSLFSETLAGGEIFYQLLAW